MVGPLGMGLAAMAATTGLLLAVAGWQGRLPRAELSVGGLDRHSHLLLRLLLGGAGFLIVLTVTGWPVAALFVGLAGLCLPTLAVAKRRRKAAVERVDAIATWAETLRDVMAASAGIQEALRTSATVAPEPIQAEVRDLALRLQHQSTTVALQRFAADMRHPLSDMVVASLIMATSRQAGGLQDVLAMTAKGARDAATMWRQVESGRARTYSQSRLAGWVSFGIITAFVMLRRDFLVPFDSFGGQIALAVICSAFFGSGLALYQLGKPVDAERVFAGVERWNDGAGAPTVAAAGANGVVGT